MPKLISYLIPILNEEENIQKIIKEILLSFESNDIDNYEIVFVDDGSTDNSTAIIDKFINKGFHIKCISLSRNFGHQVALSAGLKYVAGDYVAILDGDLQDPPSVINEFIKASYKRKADIVYGIRRKRKENIIKKTCYKLFYQLLFFLSNIRIPLDSGDFCLLTRTAVNAINDIPEKNRFIRGLRSYIGFSQIGVKYERDARKSGEVKYTFKKLLGLASDGIFNFSYKPIQISSYLGIFISFFSTIIIFLLIIQRFFSIKVFGYSPADVPGYMSIILSIFFLSGIQLFALGIIGEYISRIFIESKSRPSYFIRSIKSYEVNKN